MKKTTIFLLLLFFIPILSHSQVSDYKKGTIKVRKPHEQEFYIEIDTALIFKKGNLLKYIEKTIVYTPELKKEVSAKPCTVWVSCIVDETGKVIFAELKKKSSSYASKEALRVILGLKDFIPLKQGNKCYSSKFDIPVKFS
ncbi:MAG: hypothetical protein WCK02_17650 [Bacteroidota bacterium]